MNRTRRWVPCVEHRGDRAEAFLRTYFGADRRCLLIAGAGLDSRATIGPAVLAKHLGERLSAIFVREERQSPTVRLKAAAERNAELLQALVPDSTIEVVDILDTDNAVVGGRNAVELMRRKNFNDVTDVVVDISALSIGTSFPIMRYVLETAQQHGFPRNVHALTISMPADDNQRRRDSNDVVSIVHSFHGTLRLHSEQASARLWIPQLNGSKMTALDRIHATLPFDDVCPILPFPSRDPRRCGQACCRSSLVCPGRPAQGQDRARRFGTRSDHQLGGLQKNDRRLWVLVAGRGFEM